jgi:CRP-like cAMP-binding protein
VDELSFSRKFVQSYGKGETIFEEGSLGGEMYAVLEGSVEISRRLADGTEKRLRLLAEGEIFGEMGLVENAPRSATARAHADGTRVMVIDQAKFVYLVSQQPVFALNVMQVLCQRIRRLESV